ncbi:4-amino-4-deoxy-L-arabinose transferase-like glycosyltransferase [Allocatelliglobosispora scoriae]|uniref:4-amino-4-deoxy-L-arabinose transferase-like glycosyltransferase n=1 Tax=Allocatelliglobosispora scoriae TaxID=643052 RepID=A0A841C1X4_9ACTN|nr:glycosyltransferase family 39 protein [Allocatelliglobosispora scoriae]MBB5873876.1 4-amino-4-deoxy-L-arabinose transferase-like glycosyltransferase [Allocatelliglobosispora scoriae]
MTSILPAPGLTTAPVDASAAPRRRRPRAGTIAVALLLAATAALYLIGLSRSGWANPYYAAAAQAGSQSWKALFFGSLDSSNFITVDKAPAAVWLMAISVRLFGLNSVAVLLPQALCGIASVGLLYATVRRWSGPGAGLIAGAVLATTPVAALMFRFNNPDALLVLLLIAAAYGVTRALEFGQTRWLLLAGSAIGFAFLAKMLQALLVLPAFGLVYLIFGPRGLGRRAWQLAAATGVMVAAAGWWVLIVELWPASSRPYIGGTQDNSVLELTLGYNGFGRLTGDETGSVGGGNGWGETGWQRLFGSEMASQASWLLPTALVLLAVGIAATWRRPRTDRIRAGFLLWGGWLVTTWLVFSFMAGIFHSYYTVALAPAIGAVIGTGAALLWRNREHAWAAAAAAAALAGTGWWSFTLLGQAATFYPWLRQAILVGAIAIASALLAARLLPGWTQRTVALAGLVVALAGPAAFALQTAATAHTGAIPTAGPATGGMGGPGGGGPGGNRGGAGRGMPGGQGTLPGGPAQGTGQAGPTGPMAPDGTAPGGTGGGTGTGAFRGGGRGGMGGLLNATTPSTELQALLTADADAYDWVAATTGANNAAGYQLATQLPVMALGGFNGTDAAPGLAQFQQWVAQGRIHYLIGGSGFGMGASSGSDVAQQITAWVAEHYASSTVGGVTVYDLTKENS